MNIYDVIKNETGLLNEGFGSKAVLAWKFTGEDFNDNTQLIVSESEEAVFIRDGIAVAVFSGGRYTLNSNNHPFIGKLRNRLSGGVSAFSSRVYFVNIDHKLELQWGTDSPIQLRDPVWGLQTSVQARGSYSIQVADPKKFLIKLLGTNIQAFSEQELAGYFRSAFSQHIRGAIARCTRDSGQEILEITSDIELLAQQLHPRLAPILDEYGVKLVNFYIAAIDIPTDDPNRRVLENSIAEKQAKLQNTQGDKAVMGLLGEDWVRQQSATILTELAKNPGAGGVASAGAAAGVGLAAGSVFGEMATQMFTRPDPTQGDPMAGKVGRNRASRFAPAEAPAATATCPDCGAAVSAGAKFCPECGTPLAPQQQPCSNCGTAIDSTAKFCLDCGTPNTNQGEPS
jgi:membrane protease subunit (stomatin/prohibitin family)